MSVICNAEMVPASENLLEEGAVFILVCFTWKVMVLCPRMLFLVLQCNSNSLPRDADVIEIALIGYLAYVVTSLRC